MKKILSICICVVLSLFILSSCSKNSIVGSWVTTVTAISNIDVIYTFNEDGTGSFSTSNVSESFSYELNDTEVSITTYFEDENGAKAPSTITYTYEISDNTLTLVTDGSEIIFTRQ